MTHSETFMATKYGGFHTTFTNDYLLKHGNFFMKPTIHPDGYVYPALSEAARYQVYKDMKCEPPEPDLPLNFAIKQEKPPTPPASTSPKSPSPSDPTVSLPILNGQSKNATWILGKQKLSWDSSTVASYNPDTKMFRCVVCNAVGFLSRIAEHYLGTHTSAKVFQCLHCPYSSTWSRCVRMHMAKHHGVPNAPPSLWKGQPLLEEIFQLLTNLKTTVDSQGRERLDPELCDKKFICPKCPYTTDRRDLYLRHENIHKEDKPYHCYICFKLFNRADHVKKHFLRIHRGHPYDISLVRRRPSRMSSSSGTTSSSNNNTTNGNSNSFSVDKLISNDSDSKAKNDAIDLSQRASSPASEKAPNHSAKQLKTFQCPYCEWEGVDSWCLRRHMNVHLKSFECPICEFKAGKAERLFTHGYKAHKKLICTKCKFVTDVAYDFDLHIKECCTEIIESTTLDKICEDSMNESDDANPDANVELPGPSELPPITPFVLPETAKLFDHRMALDLKGSVSLMPLHNSISYCFPATQAYASNELNGLREKLSDVLINGDGKTTTNLNGKNDCKLELSSPVQSSSDSGVTDLTSESNDQDFTCFNCGCEFANSSSLEIHTELYHREDLKESLGTSKKGQLEQSKTKRFSCAICNFNSDKQRTIIEHMRFHTGEVLYCRAGPSCAFKTVCDSTLETHVETDHNDSFKRCPHCGQICYEKIPFIRHYRKCHHSKSCSRCKVIKRSLDPKLANGNDSLELLLKAKKEQLKNEVKPYLHHNPYSKKSSGIIPYAHCNAAMSKVAVAIPQALQRTADDIVPISDCHRGERKSRKQIMPRKLLNCNTISKTKTQTRKKKSVCDKTKRTKRYSNVTKRFKYQFRKKLLKRAYRSPKWCRLNHPNPLIFKNNINFILHFYWHHCSMKHRCRKCNIRFRHNYQVLLHRRRHHEFH